MKIFIWTLQGTHLVLMATALAAGCDANHVLGVGDTAPAQSPGAGGVTGAGGAPTTGTAGAGTMGAAGGSVGTGLPGGTAGSGTTKADPATLGAAQSWTGYEEQRMFRSGSDALALTFAVDANGVVAGTMVFGMGTPPPPATDPNVGYPPDLLQSGLPAAPIGVVLGYVSEGYSYAFDGGSFDGHRLRFVIDLDQIWAGWCRLETQASDGSSACLPNGQAMVASGPGTSTCAIEDPKTKKYVPVDCGKLALCYGISVCACTASGCTLASDLGNGASFDLFVDGNSASGSWDGTNVHFVKN
jgi:hypothetical protein